MKDRSGMVTGLEYSKDFTKTHDNFSRFFILIFEMKLSLTELKFG